MKRIPYRELEQMIHRMTASATEAARRAFALDTIARLKDATADAVDQEFTEPERGLLSEILATLEGDPAIVRQKLDTLLELQSEDQVRSIEFRPDVTELLGATYGWLDYRLTSDPAHIARIAINMVNAINYALDEADSASSVDDMLGPPQMREEHERRQRLLTL